MELFTSFIGTYQYKRIINGSFVSINVDLKTILNSMLVLCCLTSMPSHSEQSTTKAQLSAAEVKTSPSVEQKNVDAEKTPVNHADTSIKTNQDKTAGGLRFLSLESDIVANKELPKVTTIVPWQTPIQISIEKRPVSLQIPPVFAPVEVDSLKKELEYFHQYY